MTDKNPYEKKDSLFEETEQNTLDIPDFVEDKTSTNSNTFTRTDSTSIDMSIFKMSDEELYDDVNKEDKSEQEKPRKKSNATLVLAMALAGLLLLASIGAIAFALKQRNAYVEANTKYMQLQANQEAFQKQIAEKDQQIADLQKEIEDLKNKKTAEGTTYVIVDGPIMFRESPSVDGEGTTYNGQGNALNGEEYKVLEIIDDPVDTGRKWAKVDDGVYFCIGYLDSVWAKESN